MQQNVTDIFLEGLRLRFNRALPDGIRDKAKDCLLDYLGVTLAGATLMQNKVSQLIDVFAENVGCHVIGSDRTLPVTLGALINGISAHVLELDDGHRVGMVHLGAPVISSLLAVLEKENLSTEDFLIGIAVGYESSIRLACCIQPGCKLKGYHATGTCGTIGAALGISAALHFDFEQMKSALSAATTSASGLLEMIEGDSEMKSYNAGRAAMDGVTAAYLGKVRFKMPIDSLGGNRGFLNAMTDAPKLEYITDFSGEKLLLESIYVKPYAACRHCHPSIEAALRIRQMAGFRIEDVESILVDTYKLAVAGHDHTLIQGVNSAKMSIPYSIAVSLMIGKAGLDEFTEAYIQNPEIQSLADKVSVRAVDDLSALCPQKRVAIVTVITKSSTYVERVDFPKGEPENPISRQELEEKFRSLAAFGGVSSEECEGIICELNKKELQLDRILKTICKG